MKASLEQVAPQGSKAEEKEEKIEQVIALNISQCAVDLTIQPAGKETINQISSRRIFRDPQLG